MLDGNSGAVAPFLAADDPPMVRLTTGNRELDVVLGGGIPGNSLMIVMGEPGSGKTTLAEGFAFANANGDRPILYLTTLSEPHDKVVRYLQQFHFYDETKMGVSVVYEPLGAELTTDGIGALTTQIRNAIKSLSPKIIVIDSFKAIHDIATSPREVRLMLHELAGLLAAYDTTAVLVGEYRHEDIATLPEFAVVDGIIELARNALGARDERYLRVFKLRGSAYSQGSHAFEIDASGVHVYPRLVSPVEAAFYRRETTRATTGVSGLDKMLTGGFWKGSATLLAGPTGSGKTTMGIQFILDGLRQGERCLLVNFQENPTQLAYQMEQIGGSLDEETRNRLELFYYSAVELSIDRIVVNIFKLLQGRPITRVVIDALGDLGTAASDSNRMHDYLYALVQHFAVMGVTSVLTLETDPPIMSSSGSHGRLSHMADNIVFLDLQARDGVVARTLRIAKARGVAHDLQQREAIIDDKGLHVVGANG